MWSLRLDVFCVQQVSSSTDFQCPFFVSEEDDKTFEGVKFYIMVHTWNAGTFTVKNTYCSVYPDTEIRMGCSYTQMLMADGVKGDAGFDTEYGSNIDS